ncbi:MAG: glutaminyl-peptide cyclotransferase [Candidatus Aminicenantes bacterium]|nr:MAG: glutaminyl-peptide cyclotransferase [Candidatus Aminicenantes bacterium]
MSTFYFCLFFLLLSCYSNPALIPERPPQDIPYRIVAKYPHPPGSFTQGLVFENGYLYESTGRYGLSRLRKIRLETGEILQEFPLSPKVFGEGITIYKDRIIQLTWLSQIGFVYDKKSFRLLSSFRYPARMEGWGITTDGEHLIMSDGSNRLFFLDPDSFRVRRTLEVVDNENPVYNINELEYIDGVIYANVWQSPKIIIIDPSSGQVTARINFSGIVPKEYRSHTDYVLNGIAYDPGGKRLFVTGKMWPYVFEIELIQDEMKRR